MYVQTDGALNTEAIINSIERENWEQEPLNVDYYVEASVMSSIIICNIIM